MNKHYDVIIIGAGAIGSFIARSLSKYELNVLLIEKENDVCNVTSMANSAIVHSGYDPIPNTNKAKFNLLGNQMFDEVCKDLDVSFSRIGSLTLAFNDEEVETLKKLEIRAKENHVEVSLLNKKETLSLEPYVNNDVKASLFAKTCGIVDPFNLVIHAMENAVDNGVELHLNEEVIKILKIENGYEIITNKDKYNSKVVVNAAGLYSDSIFDLEDEDKFHITPRKGEYYMLGHINLKYVNHVLFPVPTNKGKGILISPTYSSEIIVGPSSEPVSSKEDFDTDTYTLKNVKESALRMMPNIPFDTTIRVFSGLRATGDKHDFIIKEAKNNPGFIICGAIESPGLVSSPAIGEYVVNELISKHFNFVKKTKYNPKVKPYLSKKKLSYEEFKELVKINPHYGINVCNCEQISLGEIEDNLSRSVPCLTIKGIKKRTRAGMGRCQGGFCQNKVLFAIAKKYNLLPEEVIYDKNGSNVLIKKIKGESK